MFHYAAFLFYMSFIDNLLALKKMNVEKGTSLECNWSLWRCSFLAHLQSSVFKLSKDLIDSIHEEGIVAYTS